MKRIIIAGAAAVLVAASAYATNCPNEMKAIDDALKTAKLDDATKKKVADARKKGEDEHKAGKHADSMKSLKDAKDLLKIK
jgi:hypothetical protein